MEIFRSLPISAGKGYWRDSLQVPHEGRNRRVGKLPVVFGTTLYFPHGGEPREPANRRRGFAFLLALKRLKQLLTRQGVSSRPVKRLRSRAAPLFSTE